MTPEQIKLIQDSFSAIVPQADETAEIFYDTLFTIAPEVKPLFKGDMREQRRKLMASLQMIVISLEKLESILQEVKDMAIRHIYYGVKEEHYAYVGEALLTALEKQLGDRFTRETKEAWGLAYNTLADVMIEAARNA